MIYNNAASSELITKLYTVPSGVFPPVYAPGKRFDNWKEAYLSVAADYMKNGGEAVLEDCYQNYGADMMDKYEDMFELVYLDDDDIPELFIDPPNVPALYCEQVDSGIYVYRDGYVDYAVNTRNYDMWFIKNFYYKEKCGDFAIGYESDENTRFTKCEINNVEVRVLEDVICNDYDSFSSRYSYYYDNYERVSPSMSYEELVSYLIE